MYYKAKSNLLLILIICFNFLNSAVQASSLIKQTGFRQYSTEQGLSQNTIRQVYQDKGGFIWIATDAGINRLDGAEIESLDSQRNIAFESLAVSAISSTFQDKDRNLWISTFESLIKLDANLNYQHQFSLPTLNRSNSQFNFAINIYDTPLPHNVLVVSKQGVFFLDSLLKEITNIVSPNFLIENDLTILSSFKANNFLYLGTSKGIYLLDLNSNSFISLSSNNISDQSVKQILLNNGTLYFTTDKALYSSQATIQDQKNNFRLKDLKLVVEKEVSSYLIFKDNLYFSIDDSVYLLNQASNRTNHLFSLSEILPTYTNYNITSLFVDNNDNFWIGTDSQGAYVWDPNSINFGGVSNLTTNSDIKLSNNTVWSFSEDSENNFWIGTDNGLNYLNVKESKITSFLEYPTMTKREEQARILSIYQADNYLWIGTGNGLIAFDIKMQTHKTYRPAFINDNEDFFIYSITKSDANTIWLATANGILLFDIPSGSFSYEKWLMPEDNEELATFVKFQDNLLWFGLSDRLIKYNPITKEKQTVLSINSPVTYNESYLTDFHISHHQIWASFSGSGIYLFNLKPDGTTDLVKHFSRKNQFADDIVFSLLPDGAGNLWASTHSGLVKIDKANHQFLVYDFYNGLPSNEFNEGASYKSASGKLLFGGSNGLLFFSPETLKKPSEQVTVRISTIRVKDKIFFSSDSMWDTSQLNFKQQDAFLTFNLSTLDYLTPHKWQYQYWLDGPSRIGQLTTKESQIVLANLTPGSYQLNIRPVLGQYKSFNNISTIKFTIEKSKFTFTPLESTLLFITFILGFVFILTKYHLSKRFKSISTQLFENEQKLQALLFDKTAGTWDWLNPQNTLQKSIIRIGINENECIDLPIEKYQSLIHPNDLGLVQHLWTKFVLGKKAEFVHKYRVNFFEQLIWVKVIGKAVEFNDKGQPIKAAGTWTDITEEKFNEDNYKLFEEAIQSIRDIIFIVDNKLNVLKVNNAYRLNTGFNPNAIIGHNLFKLAIKNLIAEEIEELKNHIRASSKWRGTALLPRKNASPVTVDIKVDAIQASNHQNRYVIVVSESTDIENSTIQYIESEKLSNRAKTIERLDHAILYSSKEHSKIAVISMGFKHFNHLNKLMNARALELLFESVYSSIQSNLPELSSLNRIDNNRFVIIIERIHSKEEIIFTVANIVYQASQAIKSNTENLDTTICTGVACYPDDGEEAAELINRSTESLVMSLNATNAQLIYANNELNLRANESISMKNALQKALDMNEFFLAYQPKYNLNTEQIVGFEVFLRWQTDSGQVLYPSQFMSIADETGLITPITSWVFQEALHVLTQWKDLNSNISFAFNLNPLIYQSNELSQILSNALNKNKHSHLDIHLEFAESHILENINRSASLFEKLCKDGYRITLDSYGKNSTTLVNLKNMPFYAIKIDHSYVRNIGKELFDESSIRSFIEFSNSIGVLSCGKGIETKEQAQFLKDAGCFIGQGYYFSDPLTQEEAKQLLVNQSSSN